MKKKGYTLIELVSVMAILSILLGSGFTIIKILRNIQSEVEVEDAVYEVNSILSYAKAYCRKNFCEGEIVIDTVRNSILFQYSDKDNRKIVAQSEKLPNNIKISAPTIYMSVINVTDTGYLKNSGTIFIKSGGKQNKISIAVGNDLVTVKGSKVVIDEEKIDEIKKIK